MSVTWEPRLSPAQLDEWAAPHGTPREDAVLQAVSILLGVGTACLQTDLSSGQSLQALAATQHVSANQLVATIAEALQSPGSGLTATQATMIAADIASHTGALSVAPGVQLGSPDTSSTSAPISGVNTASGGSSSTSGRHLDMHL